MSVKEIFNLIDAKPVAIKEKMVERAWEMTSEEVRQEFNCEGVFGFDGFRRELMTAENLRFLVKKDDGRLFAAFWSNTEKKLGIRTLGCVVVGKGLTMADKILIGKVSSGALDWFMETEPKWVERIYVGIPERFERLNRHAEEICKVKKIRNGVKGRYGYGYSLYMRERKGGEPC